MPVAENIIWIRNDDGLIDINDIDDVGNGEIPHRDIMRAAVIITDKGRVLKNRYGSLDTVKSFDLIDQEQRQEMIDTINTINTINTIKKQPKHRSIFDDVEIQADLQ